MKHTSMTRVFIAIIFTIFLGTEQAFAAIPEIAAVTSTPYSVGKTLQQKLIVRQQPKTVKMTFVGDLMVHEWQANDAYDKKSGAYDFDYCFEPIKKYLLDSDYTIGNLETTFAGKEAGYSYYPTFNAPDSFGDALKNAGFDLLTTANNHSNDKRAKGILRTIEILDKLGLEHVGTYASQQERDEPFITEINGIRFAFLSYSYGTNGIPLEKPYHVNIIEEGLIKADIQKAKALNPDFLIVMPHMGNEYERYSRDIFKNQINMMLAEGADLVIASHPHVLQPMEFIDKTLADGSAERSFVAYSMGNFVSSQRDIPREASVILNIVFEKEAGKKPIIKQASYIPTWVKFINSAGSYDIQVLSVFDALYAHDNGENTMLRPKDITRLKNVHAEISKMLLGSEVPLSGICNEYVIPMAD